MNTLFLTHMGIPATSETLSNQPVQPASAPLWSATAVPSVDVLGVRFHQIRMEETLDLLERFIAERTPRQICLANAYTVSLAGRDPELSRVLMQSDLVLADGMSIVWGARWIGVRLPQRVAGPDLMTQLCERSAAKSYRVYLCGSSPENLRQLADTLRNRWPALQIVGLHSPPMCEFLDENESQVILDDLHRLRPDIFFLGMSMPKQEKWIARYRSRLGVPVCIGVGAAFDFLSGRVPRAPEWLQRTGFEWLYRLYCEPRRLWKRYLLGNAIFLSSLLRQATRQRWSRRPTH